MAAITVINLPSPDDWLRLNTDRRWPETWMIEIAGWFYFIEKQPDSSWSVGFSNHAGDVDCIMRGVKFATRELAMSACAECARS